MTKQTKEKIKTIFLLLLIATSLLQIGIHWNQQSQGFPFNFVANIFSRNSRAYFMDVDSLKYQYFVPESIIVSMGPTASLWKLNENDSHFKSIWKDIKENYLPAILKGRPQKTMPKSHWAEITDSRCIVIKFTVNWPVDIIFWLENTYPRDFDGFKSIESIAILPQADVNETVNTLYIYDQQQVYQYQVDIGRDYLTKSFYSNLANELSFLNKPSLSKLSTITNFMSEEDILVSLNRERGNKFSFLRIEIPEQIVVNKFNYENENIQNALLLSQKGSLMSQYDENSNKIIFTDTENLYTLYDNGTFEYKYIPVNNKQAGKESAAFSHALSFIELRRGILGDADLVLTDTNKTDNYYEMRFDYKYNDLPVFFKGRTSYSRILSPLTIKANADRVLECRWVIRSFTKTGQSKSYSLYFADLINRQIPALYPEIVLGSGTYFERIEPGYAFGLEDENIVAEPQWIVSTSTGDYYIPLLGGEN